MSPASRAMPIKEFAATGKERFICVYDKDTTPMGGGFVFPASLAEGKTNDEIFETFSFLEYSQMYICDVMIWEADPVQEYQLKHPDVPNTFKIAGGLFTNERKVTALSASDRAAAESYEPLLAQIKREVGNDQAAILAPYGTKQNYFRSRKIILPIGMEDRKALVRELADSISHNNDPKNLREAIFLLFDPKSDPFEDSWVHRVAHEYDHEGKRFKPHLANQLYIYSALAHEGFLGACAAFFLGIKFLVGHEREIDTPVAAKWFEIANHKGHPAAKLHLSHIYRNYDPRYRARGHEEFTARVDGFLENSKAPPLFHQYTVDTVWRGTDPEAQTQAVINFQQIANGASPFKIPSRWHIAMRSLLGLGLERNLDNTREYLALLPDMDDAIPMVVQYSAQKAHLKQIVAAATTPALAEAYKNAAQAVCHWYTAEDSGQALDALIAKTPVAMLRPVRDTLWVTTKLAAREEWRICGDIGWKLFEMRMQQANVRYDDLKKSALITGPRYNAIGQNGLPILGAWEEPAPSAAVAMAQMSLNGHYVPPCGAGLFNGLTTTPDGYIHFNCTQSGNKPGLLFQEDFDVAMILAFAGEQDGKPKVIWPYLSMESADIKLTDGHEVFNIKEFGPEWMGYTDFGRTMYITDVLSGALAWNPQSFPIAEARTELEAARSEQMLDFLKDLSWTGGRTTRSTSSRVMLRTEHIQIEGREPKILKKKSVWDIRVRAVKMRVDGSYILKRTSGEENRLVALNDTTYQHGAVTQKLTDNYDLIAGMMPVFERARQLMGLFYSLAELQTAGFQPNPKLMAELKTKYGRYAKLPKLPRSKLLAQPFPHD